MKLHLLFWAGLIFFAIQLPAIDVGGRMSQKDILGKLTLTAGKALSKKTEYQAYVFFNLQDLASAGSCLNLLDRVASDQIDFPGKKSFAILALAADSPSTIRNALTASNLKEPEYPVYADEERRIFMEYAREEYQFPFCVISDGSKVIWKGSPVELSSVIKSINGGTFSFSTQLRVAQLKKQLQTALQIPLPDVISRTADQILAIDPGDTTAISAKLFAYDAKRDADGRLKFLQYHTVKHPEILEIRMFFLNGLLQGGSRAAFQREYKAAAAQFGKDPFAALQLLSYGIESAPFLWLPLDDAAKLASSVLSVSGKFSPRRKAIAYELSARVKYMQCDLAGAIRDQEMALKAAAGTPLQKQTEDFLSYLKAIAPAASK